MLARTSATAHPELELKFQLGAGAVRALGGAFPAGDGSISHLHAVYFDTPTRALRDAGYSLRVRRKGDTYTQTLKHRGDGGLFQRDEWESEVPGPDLDLGLLGDAPIGPVIGEAQLSPAFTVDVERRVHVWRQGDFAVEVSIDVGTVTAGDRSEPIAELELELLQGSPRTLFDLGRALLSIGELTPMFESKSERGYRLAGHDSVAAFRAQASAVRPETTAAEAFQLIAREALVQVAGNARLLIQVQSPEALHQLRVGLRRLRVALWMFRALLDAPGLDRARAEARWLAGELAPARDLDVLLVRLFGAEDIEEDAGRAALLDGLRRAQADAYRRAHAALGSDRFRQMLLFLAEWIDIGPWLSDAELAETRAAPAVDLAAAAMNRADAHLRKGARRFESLTVEARHELRKQAKKLRYAAAFFQDAFREHPRRRTALMTALKAVQERLGELNDVSVAQDVALAAVAQRSGELAFAAGLEIGRLTRDEAPLIDAAAEALKTYRRRRSFWSAAEPTQ